MDQSETIFVKPTGVRSRGTYDIRSFTPFAEEPFCGHGIAGAAIALRGKCDEQKLTFRTVDGITVHAERLGQAEIVSCKSLLGQVITVKLQIPSVPITESLDHEVGLRDKLAQAIHISPSQILGLGRNSLMDLVVEVDCAVDFSAARMKVDAVALMKSSPPGTRSQIITSEGRREGVDFVKRVFAYGSEGEQAVC
jgi:predicted PhzF superfamily epimerase YddE/YHI9